MEDNIFELLLAAKKLEANESNEIEAATKVRRDKSSTVVLVLDLTDPFLVRHRFANPSTMRQCI